MDPWAIYDMWIDRSINGITRLADGNGSVDYRLVRVASKVFAEAFRIRSLVFGMSSFFQIAYPFWLKAVAATASATRRTQHAARHHLPASDRRRNTPPPLARERFGSLGIVRRELWTEIGLNSEPDVGMTLIMCPIRSPGTLI